MGKFLCVLFTCRSHLICSLLSCPFFGYPSRIYSWYDQQYILPFNSGTTYRKTWSGKLIGLADYENNPQGHPFVIKLETGTSSDWFLGFNRATGVNRDSKQARNEVTVYKVEAGDGLSYSHSFLKASVTGGNLARITDWRDTGRNLVIDVKSINLYASPAYADVEIVFEGSTPPETSPPTRRPTLKPTLKPTPSPTDGPTNVSNEKMMILY